MTTVNVTNARKDLYGLVHQVLASDIITIVSKEGSVVMISEEDWESFKETLYLMGDPDFLKDVEEARNTPAEEREAWN